MTIAVAGSQGLVGAVPAKKRQPKLPYLWFTALLAAICFEGVLRKFSLLPGGVLYFAKDIVLLSGLVLFGLRKNVRDTYFRLFGPLIYVVFLAFAFTVLQVFNPEHLSLPLGVLGVRSYWLWWIAPVIVANALAGRELSKPAFIFGLFSLVIALFAAYQFTLPPDAQVNSYAWGDEDARVAVVHATGKVRVSSTFSYLYGLAHFASLAPPLLLTFGLIESRPHVRAFLFSAAVLTFAAGFMSGSRSSLVNAAVALPCILQPRTLLRSRATRWAVFTLVAGGLVSMFIFEDALAGVVSRFSDTEESATRMMLALASIPPLAPLFFDYPTFGLGTGMMLPARIAFGIDWMPWAAEVEPHRMLADLGLPGYLMVSAARIALAIALYRAHTHLKRHGKFAFAGLALALVPLGIFGRLAYDHVYQALFFMSFGIVIAAMFDPPRAQSPANA